MTLPRSHDACDNKFYTTHKKEVQKLVETCRKYQGQHLIYNPWLGNPSITYSNEFIEATAKLYKLFINFGCSNPIENISSLFQKNNIRSCRGCLMDKNRVEYLIKNHIIKRNKGDGGK